MYIDGHEWLLTKMALSIFLVFGAITTWFSLVLGMCIFLLFLLFLAFKIAGIILWSWWLVTIPLWGVPAFIIALGCLMIIPAFFIDLIVLGWNKFKGDKI